MIIVESKRKKAATILKKYPEAILADVTSGAKEPRKRERRPIVFIVPDEKKEERDTYQFLCTIESRYKKDIDWTHVDKEIQRQMLREYDFFWNIEKEIQPEWYKPKLDEKRNRYMTSIHLSAE